MSEALRHHGEVDPGGEEERRLTVAEVVKTDRSEARLPGQGDEVLRHAVRLERHPVRLGEDEVVIDVPRPPRLPVGVLGDALRQEGPGRPFVEVDDPCLSAGRLRRAEGRRLVAPAHHARVCLVVPRRHEGLTDGQDPPVDVDIRPP
nr:hypothetical protein [Kineococcus rhizosphaerae]